MNNEEILLLREKFGVKYYTIPTFENTKLTTHMFTTRVGGYSSEPFNFLNFGIKTNDSIENIKRNFKKLGRLMETHPENFVFSNQVHGTNIQVVQSSENRNLFSDLSDKDGIDGLLTNKIGITLVTFYADCVPLFYLDPKKKIVGLAHGGWRGTVNKIAGSMVDLMKTEYGSRREDILVGIGPSIGQCCYEVKEEVYNEFNNKLTNLNNIAIPTFKGKWKLDLKEANKQILQDNGILSRNITICKLCTSCNTDLFYSHRKESGNTGRMVAAIKLKEGR